MSSSSKKTRTKPPKAKPAATSALTQPIVEDSSTQTVLSSFSGNGSLFAFVSLAVDKHRLRVHDTTSNQLIADYTLDSSRVTSLVWYHFDTSDGQGAHPDGDSASQPSKKKKRRKSQAAPSAESTKSPTIEVVVLGLADGSLQVFSPARGRVVRTLSDVTSTSAILSVAVPESNASSLLWASGEDGAIRVWDARKNAIVATWKQDVRIPYSAMAFRPSADDEDRMDVLVANHSIRLLSVTVNASDFDNFGNQKPKELASFTGHASPVTRLQWDASQTPSTRFVSMAEGDRVIYIWQVPDTNSGTSSEGRIIASIPLDSDARAFSFSIPLTPSVIHTKKQSLLALSTSGKIAVFPLPSELSPSETSPSKKSKVPTLVSRSRITVSSKKNDVPVHVVAASFSEESESQVRVARLAGGVKLVFDLVECVDDSGNFIENIDIVSEVTSGLAREAAPTGIAPNKRYAEPTTVAVHSGVELGHDETMDNLPLPDVDGDLDVDLAEMSLGQRLTALSNIDAGVQQSNSDSENEGATEQSSKRRDDRNGTGLVIPAASLTQTLIQALHSSDSKLLETCLTHSRPSLILNTVQRLPPQLAVPLLLACVERLSRGARAANMKGGGGGPSSQRGTGLINWVKAVLTVHSGHLMTMPDLVARLAGLHATLTSRLTLQESLLELNGRLDLVLSQMEMRSSIAPAPIAPHKGQQGQSGKRKAKVYVEGESSDEDRQMDVEDVDVEIESGDDAGSIEDVELGGDSQDEDDDGDGEDVDDGSNEDEGDSEGDNDEPKMNGFIDDEAEEDDDEESIDDE